MSLDAVKLKKLLIRFLPYILIGLVCTIWEKPGE
jgi:hypothetical protein